MKHKISAYADDMLFSLPNPMVSLPNLFHKFEVYVSLSNLKIHFSKSEAIVVKLSPFLLQTLKSIFKFKWTELALKYQARYIPNWLSQIF